MIDVTGTAVTIDGLDVTREIRTPEIDRAAAAVARLPRVRAVLVERQREIGAAGGIVMEGRDIGTVVFPDADVKVYLDAVTRRARAPPRQRSGALRRSGRRLRRRDAADASATSRSHADRRRRSTRRRTPS